MCLSDETILAVGPFYLVPILSPTHASRAPTMQRAVATRHFGGAHNRIRDRADWCKVFHLSVFIFVLSVLFCCNYAHASMAMPSCLLTI